MLRSRIVILLTALLSFSCLSPILASSGSGGSLTYNENKYEVNMDEDTSVYIGVKMVSAKPMTLGVYNRVRGWDIPKDEDPSTEGYQVTYPDGYVSWCPKKQFEKANRPVDGMPFGHAIEALKIGKKVARAGWIGKEMFLFYLPPGKIPKKVIHDGALKSVVDKVEGDHFEALGSIRMFTSDKKILTGWLASQPDIMSDDWHIIT